MDLNAEPAKPDLERIDRDLEDAMDRLNESNRRVDELLSEFGGADAGAPGPADAPAPVPNRPIDPADDTAETEPER